MSTKSQLQEIYIGLLGRAADAEGLDYWAAEVDAGTITLAEVRENIVNDQPEYEALFAGKSRAQTVNQLYINLFGRAAEADGLNYWVNGEGANVPADLLVFALSDGAAASDRLTLDNRVEVAQYYTDNAENFSAGAAAAVIADVDSSNQSVADAKATVNAASEGLVLTQRADNLVGTDGDDVFSAPVTQNETGSGELANTLETGDRLDGGAGHDILKADLIASGSIGLGWQSPAISPTTTNIEEVHLRAQNIQGIDAGSNTTATATVDAERMEGVEQWWSDNSRADVRIEDIRSNPAGVTFGLKQTDPEVGFEAYFNPLYLEGDLSRESALSLTIQEITNGQNPANTELQNITVREINFELDGEGYTLNNDALRAANTWAELETAIAAELLEQGLADLTVTHRGNGQFLVEDTQGREFGIVDGEALILGNASGIDVRNRAQVGVDEQEGPTQTTLILDAAGNGSRGGDVNIAAMSGDRGIEVMDVQVDRDSHIRTLRSENNPADSGSYAQEQQLEVVNLSHVQGGASGSLQLGSRTVEQSGVSTTTDDRLVTDGLLDVRVFDATGFTSSLKLGASLTDAVFDKYLDGAEEAVQFSYLLGDGGSNLNLSVDNDVASDPDFALEIIGGAGDDRINLSGLETKSSTVINGGAGNNTVEVNTTTTGAPGVGFAAGQRAWAEFSNIQTLVVAGSNDTVQNLVTGNMASVENVVVATGLQAGTGVSTTVEQLRMDQGLTVSGQNQTLGSGNSNNNQLFNTIAINGTSAVPGVAAFDLLLDNTARIDGVLAIDSLSVGNVPGAPSAISTLNIASAGRRDVSNVIDEVSAGQVSTFNLVGTQDLSIANLVAAANHAAANPNARASLVVDGSDLGGDLYLGIDSAVISAIDGGTTSTVTLTGTAGDSDVLALNDAGLDVRTSTSINGFETIAFGDGAAASGRFNAVGVNGVELYDIVALDLTAQTDVEAQIPGAEADVDAAELAAAPLIADIEAAEAALAAGQTLDVLDDLTQDYDDALADYDIADPATHTALVAAYNALHQALVASGLENEPPAANDPEDSEADQAAAIDADDVATQAAITAEDTDLTAASGGLTVTQLQNAVILAEAAAAPALADLADAQAALDALIASAQSLTVVNLRGEVDVRIDGDDADGNILLNEEAEAATTNVLNVELVGDYRSELTANSFNTVNVQLSLAQGQQTNDWDFGLNVDQYARTLNVTGGSATQTAVSSVELIDLSTSLTRIDFSGFVGDVEAGFGLDADIPVTNSIIVLNGFNFEWDNSSVSDEEVVTTFRINSEAVSDSTTWTFDGFKGFNADEAFGHSLSNLDILDLRGLGVEGLSNIVIEDDGTDTTITSNDGLQFEIVLTGVAAADISNENFMFAA